MMKLLLVTRRYPPFGGGAENQLHRLAEALAFNGHQVSVLTGKHQKKLSSFNRENGVRVYRLPDYSIRFLGSAIFLISLTLKMFYLAQRYDFVITSMINETSTVAVLNSKILGKKICLYPSAVGVVGNIRWAGSHWCGFIYKWVAKRVDTFACQSKDFFPELISLGINKNVMNVIPNTISRDFLAIGEKRTLSEETLSPAQILWCGRLAEEKDPIAVLAVGKILQQKSINALIDIAGGSGTLFNSLQDKLEHTPRLNKIVRLHENPKNVLPFFLSADIFLLTSREDAMPLVIIEAMASGIPIVATNVGGLPQMIENEVNGLLVPAGDAEKMAEAIIKLINSPSLRETLVTNGRDYIMKHHHPDQIAKQYELIFTGLKN